MGESPISGSGLVEELRHTPGAASGTGGDAATPAVEDSAMWRDGVECSRGD